MESLESGEFISINIMKRKMSLERRRERERLDNVVSVFHESFEQFTQTFLLQEDGDKMDCRNSESCWNELVSSNEDLCNVQNLYELAGSSFYFYLGLAGI